MKTPIVVVTGNLMLQSSLAPERGIIDNSGSPHVGLKSTDIGDCLEYPGEKREGGLDVERVEVTT